MPEANSTNGMPDLRLPTGLKLRLRRQNSLSKRQCLLDRAPSQGDDDGGMGVLPAGPSLAALFPEQHGERHYVPEDTQSGGLVGDCHRGPMAVDPGPGAFVTAPSDAVTALGVTDNLQAASSALLQLNAYCTRKTR